MEKSNEVSVDVEGSGRGGSAADGRYDHAHDVFGIEDDHDVSIVRDPFRIGFFIGEKRIFRTSEKIGVAPGLISLSFGRELRADPIPVHISLVRSDSRRCRGKSSLFL